jgi:hypothetical protein
MNEYVQYNKIYDAGNVLIDAFRAGQLIIVNIHSIKNAFIKIHDRRALAQPG